jgi:hypothetical protein
MNPPATPPGEDTATTGESAATGTYLAECFWPGVTTAQLADAAERAARDGNASCLELILLPADEIVLGLYLAPSPAAVTEASRRAGLPAERVVRSVHIKPTDPRGTASGCANERHRSSAAANRPSGGLPCLTIGPGPSSSR